MITGLLPPRSDRFHPIVDGTTIVLVAIFEHQKIEAALSEKEPVRSAHHFLTAESQTLRRTWQPCGDQSGVTSIRSC